MNDDETFAVANETIGNMEAAGAGALTYLKKLYDTGDDFEATPFARITREMLGIQVAMSMTGLTWLLDVLGDLSDEDLHHFGRLIKERRSAELMLPSAENPR